MIDQFGATLIISFGYTFGLKEAKMKSYFFQNIEACKIKFNHNK